MHGQGFIILSVANIAFIGSTRFGSGVIIARLGDGSWSPPSAVATGGVGFGGVIGMEITDFVFVLNSAEAVRTFTHGGSLMLGMNVSVAMGPFGRSAEVDGGASKTGTASIFSYSKCKGVFTGVSVEGAVLVERSSANKKLYNQEIKAKRLLNGEIVPPPEVEPLMRVLASDAFHPDPQTLNLPEDRAELSAGALNLLQAELDSETQPPGEFEPKDRLPTELDTRGPPPAESDPTPRLPIELDAGHLPAELDSETRPPDELDSKRPLPAALGTEPRLQTNAPA